MIQKKKVEKNVADICFIVCPDYWAYSPSLAIATLAGVLKYAKYKVKIADINVESYRIYASQSSFTHRMSLVDKGPYRRLFYR